MKRHHALSLILPLLLCAPALAKSNVATVTKPAEVRAGPGAEWATWGTIGAGERIDVILPKTGEAFTRISSTRYYVRKGSVRVSGKTATASQETTVYDSRGRAQGKVAKDAKLKVRSSKGQMVIIYGYLPSDAVHAPLTRTEALPGKWATRGTLTPGGEFTGHVFVVKDGAGFKLRAEVQLAGGQQITWTATGDASGSKKLEVKVVANTPGLAGILSGAKKLEGSGKYTVKRYVRGGWESSDGKLKLKETWSTWAAWTGDIDTGTGGADTGGGDTGGGDTGTTNVTGKIVAPAKALAVPGKPEVARADVKVEVSGGKATLTFAGAGRLLRNGEALTSPLELAAGTHTLSLEGAKDGAFTLSLNNGSVELAKASTEVVTERLYLILFGYEGGEEHYLEGDVSKCRRNLVPKLGSKYSVLEDGKSYDQAKIDKDMNDPAKARKIVLDWCTTRADLLGYMARGTVRAIFWGSHGFMEPFPDGPDSDLDLLESRVWSCAKGQPSITDARNFSREFKAGLAASVKTHGKLDFIQMHSCATGGLGTDYRDDPYQYTRSDTKTRAKQLLGDPLPTHDKLRYRTFDELKGQATYLRTYVGSAYFGLHDVSWYNLKRAMKPAR
jgi:hypothetical protein